VEDVLLILITTPDRATADLIANALVEERLAACVNIVPGIRSVYRWKGLVEQSDESLLLVKSTMSRFGDLESRVRDLHPFELPEIIAVTLVSGLADYLHWVRESTSKTE